MVLHDLHGGEDKKEWVELFQKKKKNLGQKYSYHVRPNLAIIHRGTW